MLFCVFGTGDSFSRHDGQIEFVGLYESEDIAKRNKKAIEKNSDEYRKDHSMRSDLYSVELEAAGGKKYKISAPWNGYFESLDEVNILPIYLMES